MPGRPTTPLTDVGAAIMHRAAVFGYPTIDQLAAAAGLSNRTVGALCHGERPGFSQVTYARLEARLLIEPGSIEAALEQGNPLRLRFAAEADAGRETQRRELGRLLASARIMPDPARLRSGASRLRAAASPRDAELADVAALADLVAAVLDGTSYERDTLSERLSARSGLTAKDRAALGGRARRRGGGDPAGKGTPGGIPEAVFRAGLDGSDRPEARRRRIGGRGKFALEIDD